MSTEDELFASHGVDVATLGVRDLGPMLDAMARELATCRELLGQVQAIGLEVAVLRELLKLLVDWAGARDRVMPSEEEA